MIKGIKVIKVIKPFCLVFSSVGTIVLLHRFRLTLLNIFPSYVSAPRGLQGTGDSSPNSSLQGLNYTSYSPCNIFRAQRTRTFVSEISVRKTGDILKPQYGFRQCYGTLKTVLQRNSKNSDRSEER